MCLLDIAAIIAGQTGWSGFASDSIDKSDVLDTRQLSSSTEPFRVATGFVVVPSDNLPNPAPLVGFFVYEPQPVLIRRMSPSSVFAHIVSGTPSSSDMDSISHLGHLIVVANRLPVTITKDASGNYHFKMSSGGLVSALTGFKKSLNFTWIGWPGFFIPPKDRPLVDKRLMEEYSCQAVYLEDDIADRHYNGFSNSILWPLFHYHPGEMNFDEENWTGYRQANMRFAEAVRSQVTPGAMVWVQDYHLMLLPMMLRGLVDGSAGGEWQKRELSKITEGIEESFETDKEKVPGVKIGFFLHTPFPSSEIYRCVSSRLVAS